MLKLSDSCHGYWQYGSSFMRVTASRVGRSEARSLVGVETSTGMPYRFDPKTASLTSARSLEQGLGRIGVCYSRSAEQQETALRFANGQRIGRYEVHGGPRREGVILHP